MLPQNIFAQRLGMPVQPIQRPVSMALPVNAIATRTAAPTMAGPMAGTPQFPVRPAAPVQTAMPVRAPMQQAPVQNALRARLGLA